MRRVGSCSRAGVLYLGDMLPETAYTKLLWALGRSTDPTVVRDAPRRPRRAGEVETASRGRGPSVKAGLEVHQQLATGKLFCACPADLSETVTRTVTRRLRATGGENFAIDAAAAFQASRNLTFEYEATPTSCLVELDEEPPHALDPEALDVALTMALLLDARPLDEIEVMRKIVVDGSNTSGFQRTALVAVDGRLEVEGRTYTIPTICLEEDAARKVGESKQGVRYRLDRLRDSARRDRHRPRDPSRARKPASSPRNSGSCCAPRGGSVEDRDDPGGCQRLRGRGRPRGAQGSPGTSGRSTSTSTPRSNGRPRCSPPATGLGPGRPSVPDDPPADLSEVVRPTASGPLAEALRGGGVVLGIGLPGFGGLLAPPGTSRERLGRELADRARAAGLRGLLHSDEVPAHGVEGAVVETIRKLLGVPAAGDAFVLVGATDPELAARALAAVRERARAAIDGIPSETRDPLPDGRTRYSRPSPRPGPDVSGDRRSSCPRLGRTAPRAAGPASAPPPGGPGSARGRARPLGRGRADPPAGGGDRAVRDVDRPRPPGPLVAQLLAREIPATHDDDEAFDFPVDVLDQLLAAVARGEFAKEGIGPVVAALANGAPTVSDAVAKAGLQTMSRDELARLAQSLVAKNGPLIAAKGPGAFSPLMGDLMREVRGRRDGQEVAAILREALAKQAATGAS